MNNRNLLKLIAQLATLPFILIALLLILNNLSSYQTRHDLDTESVASTVEKYVIQCYASEGAYPPNLDYLSDHYGLILDLDHYIYDYQVFASNVLPEITVHINSN